MTDISEAPIPLEFTKEAADVAISAIEEEGLDPKHNAIRVSVLGGGCGGMQYSLDINKIEDCKDYDFMFNQHGVTILIDQFSATHLVGTKVEYMDNLHNSGFKFINPSNLQRTCGCGQSFGY